ncbi:MAG TPA: hypothetical protein VH478_16470 [Trebonia sp.]|nr:hypothetical protein [Trebonia sp.]
MSERLVRDYQNERIKDARESRLAKQAAELRRLRLVQQRAERRLQQARQRASSLAATITATS